MSKSYIITGVTSMIGTALCQHISSIHGNTVYGVCRQPSYNHSKLSADKNCEIIYCDLEHINDILNKIESADVFINLAWTNTDHDGRNNANLQTLNIEYAKNAMKVASLLGCKLFVEAGSQAEYGINNGLITEDSPCHPDTEYGKAKLRVWQEGSALCAYLGMKYLHLRIFSVFGENDRPWTLFKTAMHKMIKNEPLELSACTQNWNYLYVEDCAKQIYLLCKYGIATPNFNQEIYNIASTDTRPLKEYVEELKITIGSLSYLHYGILIPEKIVFLNPSIDKTRRATNGFIADYTFQEAVKRILQSKTPMYEKGQ